MPQVQVPARPKKNTVFLFASGDLRLSANQACWQAQKELEAELAKAIEQQGYTVVRGHEYDVKEKHGFLSSQKQGMEAFAKIHPEAPVIVAEAVWQYSHHVLSGLISHQGPILTVANWSGQWPGLVGMLNLNGSLTKAGVKYSTLWGEDFSNPRFLKGLQKWLETGKCTHPTRHVVPWKKIKPPTKEAKLGQALAAQLKSEKAIMGVFDEGCMGMFNAIIPDHLLNPTGVYKERLSQSALYFEATQVSDDEAREVRNWMEEKGMTFHTGPKHREHLTDKQILVQCKTYIAAARIADDFRCDCIGIQYQQGLKDLMPASDLVEGALNNEDRPPVKSRDGKRVLYKGEAIPHFNEADECAGLDALMTYRIHKAMGQPVESTLHDIRWGDVDQSGTVDDYVWVLLISGAAPPAHFGGWKNADGHRQPAMYFPNGGSTLRGVSMPGEIVWSRIFIEGGRLKMDLGRARVVELPREETERRWKETTFQWPIMHAVTYGMSRDQLMARHKANHIHVAYAKNSADADRAMFAKAAMAEAMGMEVALCGTRQNGKGW
ncbi:MAG: fucose isomerase [Planctomycetales bacterium]|nr:fucose isomerase [Planctomycetales bacterium]